LIFAEFLKEGLFIFCGIFSTHPAAVPLPLSPYPVTTTTGRPATPCTSAKSPKNGARLEKIRTGSRSGRKSTGARVEENQEFILNLLLTSKLKRAIIAHRKGKKQAAFLTVLPRAVYIFPHI
jgi:hypothetical protein